MGIDNLAKVFGPTVVGYSVPTPQPMQMISETKPQQDVITALLEHNTDYWTDILSGNYSEVGSLEYDYNTDTPDTNRRLGMCYFCISLFVFLGLRLALCLDVVIELATVK